MLPSYRFWGSMASQKSAGFVVFLINEYIFGCTGSSLLCGLSLVAGSRGYYLLCCEGLLRWLLLLWSTGSRCTGLAAAAHRLSCCSAYGIFLGQGLNACPLLWQADSYPQFSTVQFSSVAQSCPTLCDMNHSTPGLPVNHQLPEFTQSHVHLVGDAIQPSHPQSSPSPPAPNPSQHQSLFQ